jgi:hypothetical protein
MFSKVDPRRYAALRLAIGALAFATLLGLVRQATFHYSDAGWLPLRTALEIGANREWTVLHFISSVWGVRLFFLAAITSSLALFVGYKTRWAAWLTFIFVVSLHSRNWLITYGGDAVLRLMLFHLALSDSGAIWSVDSWLRRYRHRRRQLRAQLSDHAIPTPLAAPGWVPGWPLRLIQIQIAVIYMTSGWAKLHGEDWTTTGEAMSLVFLNPVFAKYDFGFVLTSGFWRSLFHGFTRVVLIWECLFSVLVLQRWGRVLALSIGLLVHGGSILFLQIHWFGYMMLAGYLVFLPKGLFRKIEVWVERRLRSRSAESALRLVYNADCPVCERAAVAIAVLGTERSIELVFNGVPGEKRVLPRGFDSDAIADHLLVTLNGKAQSAGARALLTAGASTPRLWILRVLARLPGGLRLWRLLHWLVGARPISAPAAPDVPVEEEKRRAAGS